MEKKLQKFTELYVIRDWNEIIVTKDNMWEYWLHGNLIGICGDVTGIRGDISDLYGDVSGIIGNVSGIIGNVSGIRGNVSGIRGDVSCINGDVSGIRGNLDKCNITDDEREKGIDINDLIESTK